MSARPPADARTLLAQASPRGKALFRLVRRLLDELEQVVPWSLLYAPPADADLLAGRLDEMLARVERSPDEVAAELDALARAARADEEREAIAEAEFYFATLHQMTAADRQRLGTALARAAPARPAMRAAVDQLCELAADLKGKYTSAIMGAAAALVSEGRWQGVEFEAMLFPEKAEEAERNRRLLTALETLARAGRAVMASFPWQPVLASWSAGRPPDRYALVDLVSLRAHLLRLLTVANRRALYSGDYQQLRQRETRLGARLRELETLHLATLELPHGEAAATAAPFERLRELLLEIAALFDVDVVRALLGDERVRELRAAPPAAARAAAEEGLAALLAEEDLKTFVDLLVGAVRKRASIAFRAAPPAPGGAAGAVETPEAASPRRVDPEVGRRFGLRLVAALGRLTAADNPRWRAFQMVHKLQARLGALPPALWHEILPLLGELAADLLPILDEAAAAGAVPVAAVDHLRGCAERLAERDPARPESAAESAADLARIVRLLESLEAAATALAAGR
jgi:hypothetical protein